VLVAPSDHTCVVLGFALGVRPDRGRGCIIGGPVSRLPKRLAALIGAPVVLVAFALGTGLDAHAATNDNTWVALGSLSGAAAGPVLALAVDPSDGRQVLAGTTQGDIYRSVDSGQTWTRVRTGPGQGVNTIVYDPFRPGWVLAGLAGAGVEESSDLGQTWTADPGSAGRTVRALAFARGATYAASDDGVLVRTTADPTWSQSGLSGVDLSALAAATMNPPIRLVAGADQAISPRLPLSTSADGGATWAPANNPPAGSSQVAFLSAGPLLPGKDARPVLLGTNDQLFESTDNGVSWQSLSQDRLPTTDFTSAGFVAQHSNRFYVASDGGVSNAGGLWSTSDSGAHFASLDAPVSAVTALAVSNDQQPTLYVATLRPTDQLLQLWSYHDTGGAPHAPALNAGPIIPTNASGPRRGASNPPRTALGALFAGPEGPFILITAAAILALIGGLIAYLRRGRRF